MDVQANDILKEVNKGKPIVETERWIYPRADQFQKGRAYFANRIYRVNSGSFSYRQFFRGVEWLKIEQKRILSSLYCTTVNL